MEMNVNIKRESRFGGMPCALIVATKQVRREVKVQKFEPWKPVVSHSSEEMDISCCDKENDSSVANTIKEQERVTVKIEGKKPPAWLREASERGLIVNKQMLSLYIARRKRLFFGRLRIVEGGPIEVEDFNSFQEPRVFASLSTWTTMIRREVSDQCKTKGSSFGVRVHYQDSVCMLDDLKLELLALKRFQTGENTFKKEPFLMNEAIIKALELFTTENADELEHDEKLMAQVMRSVSCTKACILPLGE